MVISSGPPIVGITISPLIILVWADDNLIVSRNIKFIEMMMIINDINPWFLSVCSPRNQTNIDIKAEITNKGRKKIIKKYQIVKDSDVKKPFWPSAIIAGKGVKARTEKQAIVKSKMLNQKLDK